MRDPEVKVDVGEWRVMGLEVEGRARAETREEKNLGSAFPPPD